MGECDDSLFFADVVCSAVYPGPVDPRSTYCNAGQTGFYCLRTDGDYTGITCTDGTPSGKVCTGGCGLGAGQC
jgi:hypothetical protein